jgi:hypothetical protein
VWQQLVQRRQQGQWQLGQQQQVLRQQAVGLAAESRESKILMVSFHIKQERRALHKCAMHVYTLHAANATHKARAHVMLVLKNTAVWSFQRTVTYKASLLLESSFDLVAYAVHLRCHLLFDVIRESFDCLVHSVVN